MLFFDKKVEPVTQFATSNHYLCGQITHLFYKNIYLMKQFTNLYQVSKTLRFELQPIGKTAETFKQWLEELSTEAIVDDNNLFAKDQGIKDAYLSQ